MPHHHMVLPHYLGRRREIDIENKYEENHKDINREDSFSLRSPLQDIPLLLPPKAEALVADGVDQKSTAKYKDDNLLDQPTEFCGSFSFSFQKPHVDALVPDASVKDFSEELDSENLQSKMQMPDEWMETSEEDDHDVSASEHGQVGPCTACHCQVRYTF